MQLEADCDAFYHHWIKDKDPLQDEILRFTRALFGLTQPPFLLEGTLKQHLESLKAKYPEGAEEIEISLYVDDVISGADTVDQVCRLKEVAVSVFGTQMSRNWQLKLYWEMKGKRTPWNSWVQNPMKQSYCDFLES